MIHRGRIFMNKRDYVYSAIRHQSTDKVPYCIHLVGETYDKYGDKILEDFYNKEVMEDYKAGILTKEDAVHLSMGNFMIPVATPWWGWDYENMDASYKDPFDVPSVMPPIVKSGNYEECIKKAKYIKEKYGVYIVSLIFGSHWEKAYFTRGIENFLADIAGSPEFAQELLDFIIANNMSMLPNTLASDCYDGILLGSDWGTQNDLIMSPETWRAMIKQGEKVQYDLIKESNKHVFVHSCGNICRIMNDMVELGVDVLNPVQPECMNLRELKNNYGDKLTFWGGISTQKTLPYGTPEEVRKETQETIKLMSENGGYITCSSQEIQLDVPYENLKALIETAKSFT